MTRKEYYASQGFSGSEINNPDGEVDDLFIEHVQKLKSTMETLIQRSKDKSNEPIRLEV